MLGRKLEADYHIIHGIRTRIQNTIRCVREIPLEVEDVVFSSIASAQIVLNAEAKKRGALVIDVGGGTSDFVLYADGAIIDSGCLGLGGDHITNDISLVLKVPLSMAEKIKIEEASAMPDDSEPGELVEINDDTRFAGKEIEIHTVNQVINARSREILGLVKKRLEASGALDRVGAGLYLTGGCSLLKGFDRLAEETFGMPVQSANTTPISGLTATFENPQYATPIGLIRYAQILEQERPRRGVLMGIGKKITGLLGVSRLFA